MRLFEATFTPSIISSAPTPSQPRIICNMALDHETWQALKHDLSKAGLVKTFCENERSITFQDYSNKNEVLIAQILTQHGALRFKDYLAMKRFFIKSFCEHIESCLPLRFKIKSPDLTTHLTKFKSHAFSPETTLLVPDFLKQLSLIENNPTVKSDLKFQVEHPKIKKLLDADLLFINTAQNKLLFKLLPSSNG